MILKQDYSYPALVWLTHSSKVTFAISYNRDD